MQADLPLPDDDARAHSERLAAFIRNETAKWADVIQKNGIKQGN